MEIKSKRLHLHTNQGLNTMKEIKLEINIEARKYNELTEEDRKLVDAACKATQRSYAPYSHFSVGAAALLENGVVVTGSNQENAAYPSGLCAERTTLFYANSQYPDQAVKTLAIAARTEQDFLDTPIPPCGACRQVLLETEKRFGKPMRILLYSKSDIYIMEGVAFVFRWRLFNNELIPSFFIKVTYARTGICVRMYSFIRTYA